MATWLKRCEHFKKGYCRGTFTVQYTGLDLKKNTAFEEKELIYGGYKWKIVLCRHQPSPGDPEVLKFLLVSCNAERLQTDIAYTIIYNQCTLAKRPIRKLRIAGPFQAADEVAIPIDRFMDATEGFPLEGELEMMFDLKNIRLSRYDDYPEADNNNGTVHLEVISHDTISGWLSKSGIGIAQPYRTTHSDVCNGTLVSFWRREFPNERYWMCKRRENGTVVVDQCLNVFKGIECFGDFFDEIDGGYPWVTLIREERRPNTDFQAIDDDTILVFCKLWEAPDREPSYLGHMLVQKTTLCTDFCDGIADLVAENQDRENYSVYVEQGRFLTPKKIDYIQSPLEQFGVFSGSIVVLKTWNVDDGAICKELVLQKLLAFDRKEESESDDENDPCNEVDSLTDWDSTVESGFEDGPVEILVDDFDADFFYFDEVEPVVINSFPLPPEFFLAEEDPLELDADGLQVQATA